MKSLGVSKTSKAPLRPQSDNNVELYVMTRGGALKPSGFYAPTKLGWESTHPPPGLPSIKPRDHRHEACQLDVRKRN